MNNHYIARRNQSMITNAGVVFIGPLLHRMHACASRWLCAFVLVLLLPATSAHAASEVRSALVIGNSGYATAALKNPVNDARDIAHSLETLNFQVTLLLDQDRAGMKRAIRAFGETLAQRGGVGMFYFAGHGVQVGGRNYLMPIGADLRAEDEVEFEGIDAGFALNKMKVAGNDMNIVVLDACRDNPFASASRTTRQGLAQMDAPSGTLIAYSTAPGHVAYDGAGRNSPYAKHFLDALAVPGLTVESVFKRVRAQVEKETGDQTPWESTSLKGQFVFKAAEPEEPKGPSPTSQRIEVAFWESIQGENAPSLYEAYLTNYPEGQFVAIAKFRLERLRALEQAPEPEPSTEPPLTAGLIIKTPAPPDEEVALPAAEPEPATESAGSDASAAASRNDTSPAQVTEQVATAATPAIAAPEKSAPQQTDDALPQAANDTAGAAQQLFDAVSNNPGMAQDSAAATQEPAVAAQAETVVAMTSNQTVRSATLARETSTVPADGLIPGGDADTFEAQRLLVELGYNAGRPDGLMGPRTRTAIESFQIDFGIPAPETEVTERLLVLLRITAQSANLDGTSAADTQTALEPAPIPDASADSSEVADDDDAARGETAYLDQVEPAASDDIVSNDTVSTAEADTAYETSVSDQSAFTDAATLDSVSESFVEPTMVRVESGCFRMGSPDDEQGRYHDEGPQRRVCFETGFEIGAFEVTNAEFRAFRPDHDSGEGLNADRQPVVRVTWNDAKAYATWLADKTGVAYDLPAEAAWEFAARAGSKTMYWWGNDIGGNNANCDGCGSAWDGLQSAPVGSFAPNPWGLYDTVGNVTEWVRDEYHTYQGARVDGSSWESAGATRVLRGGGYRSLPVGHGDIRAANRFISAPNVRFPDTGFRLTRPLQ